MIKRHNEIRDLEAEILRMVCTDVEIEPVLQEITGEELNRGANIIVKRYMKCFICRTADVKSCKL